MPLSIGAHGQRMPRSADLLPGRATPMPVTDRHHVHGHPLLALPAGMQVAVFGLGCFWGAERLFWRERGVFTTAVGYAGGGTPNPTYAEVCSGLTGHAEVVRVVFAPHEVAYARLLTLFWEAHDPTQGMRQGNDVGTQYRSVIHCADAAQHATALASRMSYAARLAASGHAPITTEVLFPAAPFYFAEDAHQQYLSKHPDGYCGLRGTGVSCVLPDLP